MISRDFARYWRADAVSGMGTYVTLLALQALVVLTLDGSAGDVGWLNAARWLPYLVVGLLVGALVDGRRRLPLMVGTDLLALLKERGIRSLLLSGVATDTCVESAGRDAYFRDYYVTLVEDCCGAASEDDHRSALKRFHRDYGPIVTSDAVMAAWRERRQTADASPAHMVAS